MNQIGFKNFRKFKELAPLDLGPITMFVGENNAGKSCLIESLRLISKAAQGATKRIYQCAPSSFDLPAIVKGFNIDTQKLKVNLDIIIFNYNSSKYAKIIAFFTNMLSNILITLLKFIS